MVIEVVDVGVFYQWKDSMYGIRKFRLEVVESSIKEQCEKCFFRQNGFHCPKIPCGAIARKDGKYIFFREVK